MNARIFSILSLALLIAKSIVFPVSPTLGQEKLGQEKKTLDYVKRFNKYSLVIHSRQQFIEHAEALLDDLGTAYSQYVKDVIKYEEQGVYDEGKPFVLYIPKDYGEGLLTVPVKDKAKLDKLLKKADARGNKIAQVDFEEIGVRGLIEYSDFGGYGTRLGDSLALAEKKDSITAFLKARPMAEFLSPRSREMVNNCGATFIVGFDKDDAKSALSGFNLSNLDEEESKAKEALIRLASTSQFGLVGYTYEQKILEMRAQLGFAEENTISEVVNLEETSKGFQPTLGLPREQLVISSSARLSSFRSPAMVRLMSRQLFIGRSKDFDTRFQKIAAELFAEAWYEIKSFRIGLYVDRDDDPSARFSLVGVLDPKDPDQFLDRLATMMPSGETDETKTDRKQQEEIESWVNDLSSRAFETRRRATAKLLLAGIKARPALEQAAKSGQPERKMRARMVLQRLDKNAAESIRRMNQGEGPFWSSSRDLKAKVQRKAGRIGDHEMTLINLGFKRKDDVGKVARMTDLARNVFGEKWNELRLVRVGDRFVFLFGSNQKILEKTVENLASNKDPIRAFSKDKIRQQPENNQVEFHFSAKRSLKYFWTNTRRRGGEEKKLDPSTLSSFGFRLDDRTWEGKLITPVSEVMAIYQYLPFF